MLEVPEWICTLVGRLTLDNEALRRELDALRPPPDEATPSDVPPQP